MTKYSEYDTMTLPAHYIPAFRTSIAISRGVERKILLKTWGGIGDQICAEPTLRFALKTFKDCEIYLASEAPELFSHLNFKKVFNLKEETPVWQNYFVFDTITPPDDSNLVWQFMSHMLVNCVDFPSLCAFRCQLPIAEKEIILCPKQTFGLRAKFDSTLGLLEYATKKHVVMHAGKHWPSKTFPKDWWDRVISLLVKNDFTPVLIGADTDDNRGTVDVDTVGCVDLRNKLSLIESVYLLQNAHVLLTNDSSPMHMAASTNGKITNHIHIGFIATCKHPDYLKHWRNGQWGYREENLGLGGMWDVLDNCPNKSEKITVDQVEESMLRSWLPTPQTVLEWVISKQL